MDEVTELAENNAATEAEETTVEETEGAAQPQETEEVAEVESPVAEVAPESPVSEDGAPEGATSEAAPEEPAAAAPTRDADGFSSALPSTESEGLARKHIEGGIGYEIIFVVRSGDQALVDDSTQRVRTLIEEQCEGAIDNVRASEVRRFAYPIDKQTEGVYVVVNARFEPEHTGEIDRSFKLDENVLRHMMLKEDR